MKTVFLLFDSLNRNALECYGGDRVATPNFNRLAERSAVFDCHYAGSLPCIPARREMQTGRLNFLHRSWGPIEPFDICFPELMKEAGVTSHLISDHYHYWEDGGAGYHTRFGSAEFVRGQERDLWKAMVQPPMERFRERYHWTLSGMERRAPNMINREFIKDETDFPIVRCIGLAEDFIAHNHHADDWFLQVELFDPHEPFHVPARFREALKTGYSGPILDWPVYDRMDISADEADELRANYAAIVAMCDHYLGRLLDRFDTLDLWRETALIVTTDHGFLLGEHGWWGKNRMPFYDEIVRIPLIAWHPDHASASEPGGKRVAALTQTIDLMPSLLEMHGIASPDGVEGRSIWPLLSGAQTIREAGLFGIFGGALNMTDGRHITFRYPADPAAPLYEYTLMPMHPASYFTAEEFAGAELRRDLGFTRDYPVLRLPALAGASRPPMQGGELDDAANAAYDITADPGQTAPLDDPALEARLAQTMRRMMAEHQAPAELYTRFGL